MRLRPYTTVLPKPLMPVGDRPILDVIVRQLAYHGFERLTIVTGHLAELIEAFFGDGERFGIPIDYFREEEPLGTVGALSLLSDLDEDFLMMNGDVLTDLADEAQRQVQIAGIDPSRAGDAGFEHRQMQFQLRRKFDADEEAQHFIPSASSRAERGNPRLICLSRGGLLRRFAPRNDIVAVHVNRVSTPVWP